MRPRATARVSLLLTAAGVTTALAGPGALPATTQRAKAAAAVQVYGTWDAAGRPSGTARWLVTDAGGNCCEVYADTTSTGRVVEYGGENPWYSDDRGLSWSTVGAVVPPLLNAEGAITQTPDGSLVGVVWDLAEANRLTAYKYDADTKKWATEEIILPGQLYDRPYVAVIPGPFDLDGATVPYVTVINSNSTDPDVAFISGDGLSYQPASWVIDEKDGGVVTGPLDSSANPALDWVQGNPLSEVTPLAHGALIRPVGSADLRTVTGATCRTYVMRAPTPTWSCYDPPTPLPSGQLVSDARGRLHSLSSEGDGFTVGTSRDGGATWATTRVQVPGGGEVVDSVIRASGSQRRLAVETHVRQADGNSAFLVSLLDTSSRAPRLLRTYQVGRGDIALARDVQEAADSGLSRFDFPTVAFLPDGGLVASFADAAHDPAQMAILSR